MRTSKANFRLNWPYIAFIILAAAAGLGAIGWILTAQLYGEYSRGVPISGGWSWSKVILVDIACLVTFIVVLWKVYCDANTIIDEEHLSRPTLSGLKKIRWSDVTDVSIFGGVGYHVHAGPLKIVVSPYAYSNPDEVILTLKKRVEGGRKGGERQ